MITAGVDIGSTSSKVVVLEDGEKILSKVIIPVGAGSSGPARAFEQSIREVNLSREDLKRVIATGYGRTHFPDADQQITEITCHARGVYELVPGVKTIIDIGGQDAKAIGIGKGGTVSNFIMNDKCAAGTGRFLEVMSRILEINIEDLAELAALAKNEASISNTCTVFAESEVISQLSRGTSREDVAAGIIKSVVGRVAGLVKRIGVQSEVVMTGGVCLNWMIIKVMEKELSAPVKASPMAQLTGALGAALLAFESAR
ncbi:CoA-substrate-specific enzyme activase, putative [Desulfosporosinus orientis DSM 765]|uniref:CoA-substrate-specific enzyme activase, putative n=1 Tax=Desulfosporosinus orientis (strain ATCC 19365 / DSM 765 / NCIMB 8382 / VKM B-1628 / Singapore I) TaxID=768706 RepID=G7WJB9_DESOD|nr:acyl-CoA dehydratase activase [Desulfosporosinus orientis]AET69778.1 CoA-substrate-specific enzyme activase, putative [Desulfosporosinus orientis DSM 765]